MSKPRLLAQHLTFPEAPRWHNDRLWFSDYFDHAVKTMTLDGRVETILELPDRPSGLGWLPDGRLLVVSMDRRQVLRLDGQTLVVHADLSDLTQVACNDLVVDKDGRAYVTSVGFDLPAYMREHPAEEIFGEPGPPRGNIVCIDPDGVAHRVAHDLRLPNGAVITPDGGTLIVAETTGLRLSAYTIEPGGTLTERRVWAHLGMLAPDGICLNARGQIWVANPLAPECVLMGEGGQVIDRVEVDQFCYACMLGGPTRQTLFMLTAHNYDPEHADQVRSGHILALEVAVPGVGFP